MNGAPRVVGVVRLDMKRDMRNCAQTVGSLMFCALNTAFGMLVVLVTSPLVLLLVVPLAWFYSRVQGLFIKTTRCAYPQLTHSKWLMAVALSFPMYQRAINWPGPIPVCRIPSLRPFRPFSAFPHSK